MSQEGKLGNRYERRSLDKGVEMIWGDENSRSLNRDEEWI